MWLGWAKSVSERPAILQPERTAEELSRPLGPGNHDAADDDNVTDVELRGVVLADGANPGAANTANYATRMTIHWDAQNGCSSGTAEAYPCSSIDDGEAFTVKVYQSAIEGLPNFANGKRLFIGLYYKGDNNRFDVADYSGSGVNSGTNGFYLDIGAQHPISNNNTYILHKKGWNGINIDLDKKNIDLFNTARPNDINLNLAISSNVAEKKLYFYHDKSPINTLDKVVSDFQTASVKEIKRIKTTTLNIALQNLEFNNKIDYMNLDVEGHEMDIFKAFDLSVYKPSIISVEFLDLDMKYLEFKNNDLQRIVNSDLYKHLLNNKYHFVNWLHGDLIFVHRDFRD